MESIALPISYWYLEGFPLLELDINLDYYVLMNYNYSGQRNYGKDIGIGCHNDRFLSETSIKLD